MRVLAAYGLDDIPKMNRERTFVKSIFLLQMLQYDDQDAPEDTIIHDLTINNVRLPICLHLFPSPCSFQTPHLGSNTHTFLRVTYPESSLAL